MMLPRLLTMKAQKNPRLEAAHQPNQPPTLIPKNIKSVCKNKSQLIYFILADDYCGRQNDFTFSSQFLN